MKTLEWIHLAGYLPYKIKGIVGDTEVELTYLGEDMITVFDSKFNNVEDIGIERFKPYLHPLSDLTKEIEHNDSQFIPFTTIMRLSKNDNFKYSLTFAFIRMLKLDIEQGNRRDLINDLNNAPHWVIQKLFEWHFNVFNLPEHLWIDINTLNN